MRSGKYYQGVKQDGVKRDKHRLIAEERLGRKLTFNEVVHHIDGDINNNAPENLVVMTRAEHSRLHQTGRTASIETRRKLSRQRKGVEKPSLWKLTDEQVKDAVERHKAGESYRSIGASYGAAHTTIMDAVNRELARDKVKEETL